MKVREQRTGAQKLIARTNENVGRMLSMAPRAIRLRKAFEGAYDRGPDGDDASAARSCVAKLRRGAFFESANLAVHGMLAQTIVAYREIGRASCRDSEM